MQDRLHLQSHTSSLFWVQYSLMSDLTLKDVREINTLVYKNICKSSLCLKIAFCQKVLMHLSYTLQTVNHVTEGNLQVTPLKKLPFWCEFQNLLLQMKRGVTWVLPWCFYLLKSKFGSHNLSFHSLHYKIGSSSIKE